MTDLANAHSATPPALIFITRLSSASIVKRLQAKRTHIRSREVQRLALGLFESERGACQHDRAKGVGDLGHDNVIRAEEMSDVHDFRLVAVRRDVFKSAVDGFGEENPNPQEAILGSGIHMLLV